MDFVSMFILAVVMFGFAYFVLRSMRRKDWQALEREVFKRKSPDETAHRPNLLGLKCGSTFDVESVLKPPGEMACPSCGGRDAMVWLSNDEDTAKHEAIASPGKREIAEEDEPPPWALPLF